MRPRDLSRDQQAPARGRQGDHLPEVPELVLDSRGRGENEMIIYVSLLVALIGLLAYALASNPKIVEIGRISYFAGLLAFLLVIAGAHVLPVLR